MEREKDNQDHDHATTYMGVCLSVRVSVYSVPDFLTFRH